MAAALLYLPANRAFNSNGLAVPGAVAKLYLSGTATPANFYSNSALSVSLGSSITANGAGRFDPAYQDEATAFRLIIEDADGVELDDIDPFHFGSLYGATIIGTGMTIAADRTELAGLGSAVEAVLLNESGREGVFKWDASNLSAKVTADTRQGIYVAPTSDTTGASGAWVRKFDGPINAAWFGLAADGTDDYTPIQAALTLASSVAIKTVRLPAESYGVATALSVPDGITFEGDGFETHITALNSTHPSPISIVGTNLTTQAGEGTVIRRMRLSPFATGTNRYGVNLQFCKKVLVEDIMVKNAADTGGVRMIDCDDCTAHKISFEQVSSSASGYAVYIGGGKRCTASHVTAIRPFVCVAFAGLTIDANCTRTDAETFGNTAVDCRSYFANSHHFNINGCVGNSVTNCTAEGYGGASTNWAFQTKDASGDPTRCNIFTNCTAKDVPSGFGGQQSSHTIFNACTVIDVDNYGFVLNSMSACQVIGGNVYEFGVAGIWTGSGSINNTFDNIKLETSTATAKGILMTGASDSNNNFDNITTTSTLAAFIDIASGCNNNRFGLGCRANDNTITDASGTTVWPIRISTPTFVLTGGSTNYMAGGYFHRGMHIAKARFIVTVTITGTPEVAAGRAGATTLIAASQAVTGAATAMVDLTLATQLLPTGAIATGTCSVVGTAGAGYIQYEGIPRL